MKSTQRFAAAVLAASAVAFAFFFTGPAWAEETNLFKIRYVGPDEQGNLTLKWTSRPNDVFTVWYAETLSEPIVWNVAVADYPSGGYVTSWTDLGGQGRAALPQIPLPPPGTKSSLTAEQRAQLLERRSKLPPPPLPPDPRDPSTWRKTQDGATQEADNPPPITRFYRVSSANWPSAAITSPPSGGTVSELLTVNATGNDDVRTVGAVLLVDGIKAASVMGDSPYSFTVDTTKLLNGWRQVVVQTFDIGNHAANSPAIQLQFDNLICGFDASASAFTPNGDGLNDTVSISGSLSESAAWTLSIRRRGGSVVRTYTGQGTTLNVTWDGRDNGGSFVSLGTYEYSVSADTGAGFGEGARRISETQWRRMWVDRGAPDWSAINFHSYHGVESGTLSFVLRTYFWTYLGLAPLLFEPEPNIYIHENRIWCSSLGYEGDIVPYFLDQEFYQNLRSDNLVYMMTHGAYDPTSQFTAIIDYFDNGIGGTQIIRDQWEPYNPNGFIFVQINACQSGDAVDQDGNHDLASGFGIFSNPLTVGRAYLGWRGKIHPINAGLYTFDQLFWDNMVNNYMELDDAVADAWASTIWMGGTPVIVGDPHLTLPEIW